MQVLNNSEATFMLTHKSKILPNINMTLSVADEGIIKARWYWTNQEASNRNFTEVPDEVIDSTKTSFPGSAIGRHVIITKDPFTIQFVQQ